MIDRFYILLLIAYCLLSCSVTEKNNTVLHIRTELSDSNYGAFFRPEPIKLIRNDTLIGVWSYTTGNDTMLFCSGSAKFQLIYSNILGQKVTKTVTLKGDEQKAIKLSFDHSDFEQHKDQSWIGRLHDGDSIKIYLSTLGCFSAANDTLAIKRAQSNYFLRHGDKEIQLDGNGLNYLMKFIHELSFIKDDGSCTSVDSYTLVDGTRRTTYVDGDCIWRGYYRLFKHFGLGNENEFR